MFSKTLLFAAALTQAASALTTVTTNEELEALYEKNVSADNLNQHFVVVNFGNAATEAFD